MVRKTVRVSSERGLWVVRSEGDQGVKREFVHKSAAIAEARSLARRTRPSQVVVLGGDGRIQADSVYGLPKIQRPPYKSRISSSQIERAVLAVSDRSLG